MSLPIVLFCLLKIYLNNALKISKFPLGKTLIIIPSTFAFAMISGNIKIAWTGHIDVHWPSFYYESTIAYLLVIFSPTITILNEHKSKLLNNGIEP